jgi:hypothetical protein
MPSVKVRQDYVTIQLVAVRHPSVIDHAPSDGLSVVPFKVLATPWTGDREDHGSPSRLSSAGRSAFERPCRFIVHIMTSMAAGQMSTSVSVAADVSDTPAAVTSRPASANPRMQWLRWRFFIECPSFEHFDPVCGVRGPLGPNVTASA